MVNLQNSAVCIALTLCLITCGCVSPFANTLAPKPNADVNVSGSTNQHTLWFDSAAEAFAASQRTGLPILANFTGSDWCVFCKKLESEVFATAEFDNWASENFVLLKVDFPRSTPLPSAIAQQNENLKSRYANYIEGYPTVLVIAPDQTVLAKTGYRSGGPQAWIGDLQQRLAQ